MSVARQSASSPAATSRGLSRASRNLSRERGASLAELLVSLAISSVLLLGAFASAQQFRQAGQAAENLHELEEKARFALDMLRADIRAAGYWGLHSDPGAIRLAGAPAVRCGRANATAWALRPERYVAAANDAWPLPCPPYRNRRQPGTDVLEIRRAALDTSGADARKVQVLSSRREAVVFAAGAPPDLEGRTELRDLVVHAWYVAARSSHDSAIPSLRRKTLIRGKRIRDEEILAGVEDFQVRLAVNADGNGVAGQVTGPGSPKRVVAVRFWLLLRSGAIEPGYRDARTYAYADRAARRFSDSCRRLLASGSEVVANAR